MLASASADYNSVLDWPFYRLHEQFSAHPEWAVPSGKHDGKPCLMNGDPSFPNHTDLLAFDFSQAAVRDFWSSVCVNLTRTGFVDGCFSDRAAASMSCSEDPDYLTAYNAGHLQVHQVGYHWY